jgi:hypothetical protein
MSIQFISQYYSEVEKYIRFGGTAKKSSNRSMAVVSSPANQLPESKKTKGLPADAPKCKLKTGKENGRIDLDDQTSLTGIPKRCMAINSATAAPSIEFLSNIRNTKPAARPSPKNSTPTNSQL